MSRTSDFQFSISRITSFSFLICFSSSIFFSRQRLEGDVRSGKRTTSNIYCKEKLTSRQATPPSSSKFLSRLQVFILMRQINQSFFYYYERCGIFADPSVFSTNCNMTARNYVQRERYIVGGPIQISRVLRRNFRVMDEKLDLEFVQLCG